MWRFLILRRLGIILAETFLLTGSVLLASYLRLQQSPLLGPERFHNVQRALLIALVFQAFLHLWDVYASPKARSTMAFAGRLAQALVVASAVVWLVYSLFPVLNVGRGVYLGSLLFSSAFLIGWHLMLRGYFMHRKPRSNVLVLGTGRLARELVKEILRKPELGLGVRGFVDDKPELVGLSIVNPTVVGVYQDLPKLIKKHKIDRIVVELQDRRGRLPVEDLLQLKTQGVEVEDATSFYERVSGKIALENLKPSWMIFSSGFHFSQRRLMQKRIVSTAASVLFLLLFLPLLLLVALLIKLDSPGPVFFRQKRVGKDGRIFLLWKFRSMHRDAEKMTGAVWAERDDPRVTRLGRYMREFRIDEIPQLFNVIKGDMDLVGPRPERPEFVSQLQSEIPYYSLRHTVKPGVTGWAQINYGYANSVELTTEKLQYDLFYIKNMSWLLDAIILLQTVKTVLVKHGY